jgi:[ribosomal protein S18]-alanine N-acetyltransferase
MIRPYTFADKPALLALLQLNVPRYFHASEANDFAEYLDRHLESYFVVEENGEIIGAAGINYFPEDTLARFSWDMVHPDFQGKGIGTKLTRYRIAQIRNTPGISCIVVRTTQLVHPFYRKLGFVLEKTEKDFWAPGFDLYQMRMELPQTHASRA